MRYVYIIMLRHVYILFEDCDIMLSIICDHVELPVTKHIVQIYYEI